MKTLFLIIPVLMLSACSTCYERVYTVKTSIQSLSSTTIAALDNGTITKDLGAVNLKILKSANESVNNAATFCAMGDARASDYINTAIDTIQDIKPILEGE